MDDTPPNDGQAAEPVEIPPDALAPDTLRALIEEFVSRDGTDYGELERSLDEKVNDVRRQLDRGEAQILFDPGTETTGIFVVAR